MPFLVPIIVSTVAIVGGAALAGTAITAAFVFKAFLLATALHLVSQALAPDAPSAPRAPPNATLEGREVLQPTARPTRRTVYGQVKFVPTLLNATYGGFGGTTKRNEGEINPDNNCWTAVFALADHALRDVVAIKFRDKVFTPTTDPETGGLISELPGYDARGGRDLSGRFENGAGTRYWIFDNVPTSTDSTGHVVYNQPNVEGEDSGVWTSPKAATSIPYRAAVEDDFGNNQVEVGFTTNFDDNGSAPAASLYANNNSLRLAAQRGSDDFDFEDPPAPDYERPDIGNRAARAVVEKIRKLEYEAKLENFGESDARYDFGAVIGYGDFDAITTALADRQNSPVKMLSSIKGIEQAGTSDREKYFSGKLRGITWMVLSLPVRRNEAPPNWATDVQVIVKGKSVRVSDDVLQYSRNPAWILRDYLIEHTPFGQGVQVGGKTFSRLNEVSFEEAAAFCSNNRITMSALIARDARLEDVLGEFKLAMGGADLIEIEGALTVVVPQVRPAVRALDPDEVVKVLQVTTGADRAEKYHRVNLSYVDLLAIGTNDPAVYETGYFPNRFSTDFFANASAVYGIDETTLAEHPSLRGQIASTQSLYIDNGHTAALAARLLLAKSQDGKSFTCTCKATVMDLTVGDNVMVDLPNSGVFPGKYKLISVSEAAIPSAENGVFVLGFTHEDDRAYDPAAFEDGNLIPIIPTIPEVPDTPDQELPPPRVLIAVDSRAGTELDLERHGCALVGGAYVCKAGDEFVTTRFSASGNTPAGTSADESTFAAWNQRALERADQRFWLNVPGYPTTSQHAWSDGMSGGEGVVAGFPGFSVSNTHYMSGQMIGPTRVVHFGNPAKSVKTVGGVLGDEYQFVHSGHINVFRDQLRGVPYKNWLFQKYKNQLMIAAAASDELKHLAPAGVEIPGFGEYRSVQAETAIQLDESTILKGGGGHRWHRLLPSSAHDARERLRLAELVNWDGTAEDGSFATRSARLAKNIIEGGYWWQSTHPLLRNERGHIKFADFELRIGYPGGGLSVVDITDTIHSTRANLSFNTTAAFRGVIRVCFVLVTLPPTTFLSAQTDAQNGVYPDLIEWGLAQPQITNGGATVELVRGGVFENRFDSDTVKPLPPGATVKLVYMA